MTAKLAAKRIGEVTLAMADGNVAVVTLDAPQRRNALTPSLAGNLTEAFELIEADDDVRAAVVTGSGSAFCAGADLGQLDQANEAILRTIYSAFLRVRASSLPTVAAVRGPAVGAGFNLAMACDLRITGHSARFESRFVRLGLHPGGGASWMLRGALGRSVASAALLFDEVIDGATAERIGLAWRCVDDSATLEEAIVLARRAARAPRSLSQRIKATLDDAGVAATHEESIEIELERQLWSFAQPWFAAGRP
jgi:enoyl-CoA hydratase